MVNGKIYVGKHETDKIDDGYLGCGIYRQSQAKEPCYFHRSVNKHGYTNFKREILEFCENRENLNTLEIFWIKELNSMEYSIGYNQTKGGGGGDIWTGKKHSKESIEKMIQSAKLRPVRSEEHSKNISKGKLGKKIKPFSFEHKLRISNSNKNRIISEEQKLRLKEVNTGKNHSPETKEKIRLAVTGREVLQETRNKLSLAAKADWAKRKERMGVQNVF